jgi:hypothetical protein
MISDVLIKWVKKKYGNVTQEYMGRHGSWRGHAIRSLGYHTNDHNVQIFINDKILGLRIFALTKHQRGERLETQFIFNTADPDLFVKVNDLLDDILLIKSVWIEDPNGL